MQGEGVRTKSESASSTTAAGVAGIAGNIAARTGDEEAIIQSIFDKDMLVANVNAQAQTMQALTQQGPIPVANYAATQTKPTPAKRTVQGFLAPNLKRLNRRQVV